MRSRRKWPLPAGTATDPAWLTWEWCQNHEPLRSQRWEDRCFRLLLFRRHRRQESTGGWCKGFRWQRAPWRCSPVLPVNPSVWYKCLCWSANRIQFYPALGTPVLHSQRRHRNRRKWFLPKLEARGHAWPPCRFFRIP